MLLEETDPNVVYDMKNTLDDFRVYQKSEVDKFADIFYQRRINQLVILENSRDS